MTPSRFNLSASALKHRSLTLFFLIAFTVAGGLAYFQLGRGEDPPFTIRQMVVQAYWPGATAREMEQQVTDKIETTLQQLPYLDFVWSYSKPGESTIFVSLKDSVPPKQVPDLWYQARKKIGDIRGSLPQGVVGPAFNDEYGDVYSVMFAFEADGFNDAELKEFAKAARLRLLRVQHVVKAEIFGAQDQKVYLEFSSVKLAALGLGVDQMFEALRRQNVVASAGAVETNSSRVAVRLDAAPASAQAIADTAISVGGKQLRLGDVADVRRGYQDPRTYSIRHQGKPAILIGIVMAADGDIVAMGRQLDAEIGRIKADLPIGVDIAKVADQPQVSERSFETFIRALAEALAIVLVASFLTLGFRTGMVVALSVPLVLAITFVGMQMLGIHFHRISLGALIIALGLLVDDAIIAVEMMQVKLEQGYSRFEAATFAYTSTAFPMLTGTLVTAAGFVPVGLAKSAAGEYTNAIFWVVGLSLMVSWVVAVTFTPFIGHRLLAQPTHGGEVHHDPYQKPIYRRLRAAIEWCVDNRKTTIAVTAGVFVLAMAAFGTLVQKQFFPAANRPELIVDLRLAQGSSYAATDVQVRKLEHWLASRPEVASTLAYIGAGTPRFYLPTVPELRNANFGQVVVLTKGLEERETLFAALDALFQQDFDEVRARVQRLQNGPPVSYPVMLRVLGADPTEVRRVAEQVREVVKANPKAKDVNFDWFELSKTVRLEIDHEKARALGVDAQSLASSVGGLISGTTVTQFREGDELIDVVARATAVERAALENLGDISIRTASGAAVPLSQIARLKYELEEPILWRRNKEILMTVRAGVAEGAQGPDVSAQLHKALAPLRASLPPGYRVEIGGDAEESGKSQGSIFALMPLMAFLMLTFLMLQLQSFSKLALVVLTAPLGMIGVAAFLLLFDRPFGFVALLGVIALAGMIMRNSVILVDQISQDIRAGHQPWDAVVDATVRRARPIVLTAGTAIFAMVPLSRDVFWGPMAIALMGGLLVATALTLLFLPALYATWYRVRRPASKPQAARTPAPAPTRAVDLPSADDLTPSTLMEPPYARAAE